jgi:hypothetical protein
MTAPTSADRYRARALQFAEMANVETNPALQHNYASLAEAYFRLARHAEKNQKTDIVYETPLADAASP